MNPDHEREAGRMLKLLGRINGMSVRGFFLVDRRIFPSLLGFFLTYLVLLVEFRVDEDAPFASKNGSIAAANNVTSSIGSPTTMMTTLMDILVAPNDTLALNGSSSSFHDTTTSPISDTISNATVGMMVNDTLEAAAAT